MSTKPRRPRTKPRPAGCAHCLCLGTGPVLTEWLRRLGPPGRARQHFETARKEVLLGLKALLEARIEALARRPTRKSRGQKITVE